MDIRDKEFKAFDLFHKDWALASAGSMDDFNGCTLGWGSLGNIWDYTGKESRPIFTIYVHPERYTCEYLEKNDYFTVSFFSEEYRKALSYMGKYSGRDVADKAVKAGLSPFAMGDSVAYKETSYNFLCKKIYQGKFEEDSLASEIQDYYGASPKVYPDFKGGWQAHKFFIGEIIDFTQKND